jgi:phage tail-like protein
MSEYQIPVGFRFKAQFAGLPTGPRDPSKDPSSTFSIDGTSSDVRFQEVTGLNMELGIETFEEGGVNEFSHRLPTRAKFENLVLKRGFLIKSQLVDWIRDAIENFVFTPITVTVVLLNENQEPLLTWEFNDVWPVKWSVSDFKAQENALVIETLELAYSHFKRK